MPINKERFRDYEFAYEKDSDEDLVRMRAALALAFKNLTTRAAKGFLNGLEELESLPVELQDTNNRKTVIADHIARMSLKQFCAFKTDYQEEDIKWALQYLMMEGHEFDRAFNDAYDTKQTKMRKQTPEVKKYLLKWAGRIKGENFRKNIGFGVERPDKDKIKIPTVEEQKKYTLEELTDINRARQVSEEVEPFRRKYMKAPYIEHTEKGMQILIGEEEEGYTQQTKRDEKQRIYVTKSPNSEFEVIAIGGDALYHPRDEAFVALLARYPGLRYAMNAGLYNLHNGAMPIGAKAPEYTPIGPYATDSSELPYIAVPPIHKKDSVTAFFSNKSKATIGPPLSTPDGIVFTKEVQAQARFQRPTHANIKPGEYKNFAVPNPRSAIGLPTGIGQGFITTFHTDIDYVREGHAGYTGEEWAQITRALGGSNLNILAADSGHSIKLIANDENGIQPIVSHYARPGPTYLAVVPRRGDPKAYKILTSDKVRTKELPLNVLMPGRQLDLESLFNGLLATSAPVLEGQIKEAWILLGAPGAGKSTLLNGILKDKQNPFNGVVIDGGMLHPIAIPDYWRLLKKNQKELVARIVKADVVRKLLDRATEEDRNILFHNAGMSIARSVETFHRLKKDSHRVVIHLLTTNKEISKADAICRFETNKEKYGSARPVDSESYETSFNNLKAIINLCQEHELHYEIVIKNRENEQLEKFKQGDELSIEKILPFFDRPFPLQHRPVYLERYKATILNQWLRDATVEERTEFKHAMIAALKFMQLSNMSVEERGERESGMEQLAQATFDQFERHAAEQAPLIKAKENSACEIAIAQYQTKDPSVHDIAILQQVMDSNPIYLSPARFYVYLSILNECFKQIASSDSPYLKEMSDEEKERFVDEFKLRLEKVADIYYVTIHPRLMSGDESKNSKLNSLSSFSELFSSIDGNESYDDAQEIIKLGTEQLIEELKQENNSRVQALSALVDSGKIFEDGSNSWRDSIDIDFAYVDERHFLLGLHAVRELILLKAPTQEKTTEVLELASTAINKAADVYKNTIHESILKDGDKTLETADRLIKYLAAFSPFQAHIHDGPEFYQLIVNELEGLVPIFTRKMDVQRQLGLAVLLDEIGTSESKIISNAILYKLASEGLLKALKQNSLPQDTAINIFTSTIYPFVLKEAKPAELVQIFAISLKEFSRSLKNDEVVRSLIIKGLLSLSDDDYLATNPLHPLAIANHLQDRGEKKSENESKAHERIGIFLLSDGFQVSNIADGDIKIWREFIRKYDKAFDEKDTLRAKDEEINLFEHGIDSGDIANYWKEISENINDARDESKRSDANKKWKNWNKENRQLRQYFAVLRRWAISENIDVTSLKPGEAKNQALVFLREKRKEAEKSLIKASVQSIISSWLPHVVRELTLEATHEAGISNVPVDESPSVTRSSTYQTETPTEDNFEPTVGESGRRKKKKSKPKTLLQKNERKINSFIEACKLALVSEPDSEESIKATANARTALNLLKSQDANWSVSKLNDNSLWAQAINEKVLEREEYFDRLWDLPLTDKGKKQIEQLGNSYREISQISDGETQSQQMDKWSAELNKAFFAQDRVMTFLEINNGFLTLMADQERGIGQITLPNISAAISANDEVINRVLLDGVSQVIEDTLLSTQTNLDWDFGRELEFLSDKEKRTLGERFCRYLCNPNNPQYAQDFVDCQIKCLLSDEDALIIVTQHTLSDVNALKVIANNYGITNDALKGKAEEFAQGMDGNFSLGARKVHIYMDALAKHLSGKTDKNLSENDWWIQYCSGGADKDKEVVLKMKSYYEAYPNEFNSKKSSGVGPLKDNVRNNAEKFICRQILVNDIVTLEEYFRPLAKYTKPARAPLIETGESQLALSVKGKEKEEAGTTQIASQEVFVPEMPESGVPMPIEILAQLLVKYQKLVNDEEVQKAVTLSSMLVHHIQDSDEKKLGEDLLKTDEWRNYIKDVTDKNEFLIPEGNISSSTDGVAIQVISNAIAIFETTLKDLDVDSADYKRFVFENSGFSQPKLHFSLKKAYAALETIGVETDRGVVREMINYCALTNPPLTPIAGETYESFRQRLVDARNLRKTIGLIKQFKAVRKTIDDGTKLNVIRRTYLETIQRLTGELPSADKHITMPPQLAKDQKLELGYAAQLSNVTVTGWAQFFNSLTADERRDFKQTLDIKIMDMCKYMTEEDIRAHFRVEELSVKHIASLKDNVVVKFADEGNAIARRSEQSATPRFYIVSKALQNAMGIRLELGKPVQDFGEAPGAGQARKGVGRAG